MTLHVPLTEKSELRLREFAAAVGKDVPSVVAEAIEEKLLTLNEEMREKQSKSRDTDQWLAEFDCWVAGQRPLPYVADDSRESIYRGRGDVLTPESIVSAGTGTQS